MAIDLQADARRWRTVIVACGAILLATLAAAGARALSPEWKSHQQAFAAIGGTKAPQEIRQSETCTGSVDRCQTCHLGAARKDLSDPKIPQPLRAHSSPLDKHLARSVGCGDCHGGASRALDAKAAHEMPGEPARDPLLKEPHVEASCARCHVPGDAPGMEHLVHGARLFGELGCTICHPLSGGGRGGWDFGPDLRAGGRKSLAYLETSLTDPSANFPESTMPSFAMLEHDDKASFTDLVVFLESLEQPRAQSCSLREKSAQLARLPCASCHAGVNRKASGELSHHCVYIRERKEQLSCGGCHSAAGETPAPPGGRIGTCPVEREHRAACASCHDDLTESAR